MASERERKPHSLTNFDLAALEVFNPDHAVRGKDDVVGRVFLTFALFYNDLKGISWLEQELVERRPEPGSISAAGGQVAGMRTQVRRLRISMMHEFLKLIREQAAALSSEEAAAVIAKLEDPLKLRWDHLVQLARGEAPSSAFARAVERIRHINFHYYQPKSLARAFLAHFHEGAQSPDRLYAFVSLGMNMEQTRFYYADAAASSALEMIGEQERVDNFGDEITTTLRDLNFLLRALVESFLRHRAHPLRRWDGP
jgi:hypothetical protein